MKECGKQLMVTTYGYFPLKTLHFHGQKLTLLYSKTGNINTSIHHKFSSVAQLCRTLCDPMNHSMPGLPVHHQLPEFTQTHVH